MINVNFDPNEHLANFSALVPWWKHTGMGLNRSRCKTLNQSIIGKVMEVMSDMLKTEKDG